MNIIDLLSDTLSLPTDEMYASIAEAELGDDGRFTNNQGEDPTVNKLQELAAEKLGKEEGLFLHSGTMGNMVSLLTHAERGDSIIVGEKAHIFTNEKGTFDNNCCGFRPVIVPDHEGYLDPQALERNFNSTKASLVCIENSHNFRGGTVIAPEITNAIVDIAHKHQIPVHLDGARIFNAAVALKTDVKLLVENVDSVMFCLSKGLCAPIGSVVVGSQTFIRKAREKRRIWGGQLRQAGIVAAAGIVALEKMTERLSEDHELTTQLAEGLSPIPVFNINTQKVKTNILKIRLDNSFMSASEFCEKLFHEHKIRIGAVSRNEIRIVVYRGISHEAILEVIERIKNFVDKRKVQR